MQDIFIDMFFVALVGFGFGFGCNPPIRVLIFTAFIAALGHALRLFLTELMHIHILALATFIASFVIGILGIVASRFLRVPAEIVAFPALLPMIPGSFAYKSMLALFNFIKADDLNLKVKYLIAFFDNFLTTLSVSIALGVGVVLTILMFFEQSFMVTRHRKAHSHARRKFFLKYF